MKRKDLIPFEQRKMPVYIVAQKDNHNKKHDYFVKHYGVENYPTYLSDDITEMTENIWEAAMFCKKEDAQEVAKLCNFRCNCGCYDHSGILLEIAYSGREKDGITYGDCDCQKPGYNKEYFETVYDVKEKK